ncbi:MAG: hypothetical protein H6602_00770 [Flavobacteriales bacterium]|nr:hypothetical protein [Flavobacteriales bacterium]MCB9190183.1 hypothetical protein [Flavobacteriales bacterium]
MNTTKIRLGFLLALTVITTVFTACEETEVARAEVTVIQEYTATQGHLLQTRPLAGVDVIFYGPSGSRLDPGVLHVTDTEGKVSFEYEYEALLEVKVEDQGTLLASVLVEFKPGETTQKTIVVPE